MKKKVSIADLDYQIDYEMQKTIVFILTSGAIFYMSIAMFMLMPLFKLNYAVERMYG